MDIVLGRTMNRFEAAARLAAVALSGPTAASAVPRT